MHTSFHIELDIYPATVSVYLCDDVCEARGDLCELFGDYEEREDATALALCCHEGNRFGLFFSKEPTHDDIAHEIFHCTMGILNHIGATVDQENDEPPAYLCGYLTNWVYRNLKTRKIRPL